jgi:aminoglycoside phosphotransferase (APT) family kinase protein
MTSRLEDRPQTDLPGLEPDAVTAWLLARAGGAGPLTFSLIAGGRSNLTFDIADRTGNRYVLRRPPLGDLLPSAHDVAREHKIISALQDSGIPVPEVIGMCHDTSVTGAPFYVMRFTEGLVLRDPASAASLRPPVRRAAADALVDALVHLHAVDPDSVGLGDLGRRDGYVERQLRRWSAQWESSQTRRLPAIEEVSRLLSRQVPPAADTGIVHGDYRLDNVIVDPDTGEIRAVLDWEISTLGDPLADVGTLVVYWAEPDDPFFPLSDPPTTAAGFPTRRDVIDRYARVSGRDLSGIDYYVALAYWKLAIILEGVYSRYRSGSYGATDTSWRHYETVVPALAEAALDLARSRAR